MILFDNVVKLRAIEEKDAEVLQEMINDPEIESEVVGFSYPVSLSQQKKWIENVTNSETIRYAIDVSNKMIGVASISSIDFKNRTANINIKLRKNEQGKGYATRSVKLVLEYCFLELNMECVTANVLEYNNASKKIWEKLGFKLEGILRNRIYKNGKYHNLFAYSFLKNEFNERNW